MEKLKLDAELVFLVDYSDFEKFVNSIYGGDFEFAADQEARNDSSHIFNVSKNRMDDDEEIFAEIRKGNYPTYSAHAIFDCLLKDGHIEEGKYVVKVSW